MNGEKPREELDQEQETEVIKSTEAEIGKKINNLKDALRLLNSPEMINEGYPQLSNSVVFYLVHANRRDLANEAMKVLLHDSLRLVLSKEEDEDKRFRKMAHTPHQTSDRYFEFFSKDGIGDEKYNKLGQDFLKLSATILEARGRYKRAAERYETLNMKDRAEKMRSEPDLSVEDTEGKNEDSIAFNNTVSKMQDDYKDFVFMNPEERNQILENIKQQIELELQGIDKT